MNSAPTPALILQSIAKSYRRPGLAPLVVLAQADLTLAPGEVVALVAPSGAGKSTLLHIAGLPDAPDAGRVVVNGRDMTGAGDRRRTEVRRQSLGFVYQFHHLLPEFTALENITLPQRANGVAQDVATSHACALLDRVGLSDRADHRPAQLSGGEQQRVAFCRALANNPKVLLADEPTGNLDPATAETVFGMLLQMVRETGLAALVATHNPDLAARMDRTLRLQAGHLVPA